MRFPAYVKHFMKIGPTLRNLAWLVGRRPFGILWPQVFLTVCVAIIEIYANPGSWFRGAGRPTAQLKGDTGDGYRRLV